MAKRQKSKAQKWLDRLSFELPYWLSKRTVYLILGVFFAGVCIWAIQPFFKVKGQAFSSATKPSLHYEYYDTVNACVAKNHSQSSCEKALDQVKKMTVSELPLYKDFSDCQERWNYCIRLNTGHPVDDPQGQDVIVALPLIRGFKVAWDGSHIQDAKPLFQNNTAILTDAEGVEDPALVPASSSTSL